MVTTAVRIDIATCTFPNDTFSEEAAKRDPISIVTYRRHMVNHYAVSSSSSSSSSSSMMAWSSPPQIQVFSFYYCYYYYYYSIMFSRGQHPTKEDPKLDFQFWEYPIET